MTYDVISKPPVTAHDWALHRYGIISPAVSISVGEKISDILAGQAAQVHRRPDGTVHRYNVATLRVWFSTYLADGFDGLKPKVRCDKGTFRSIDEDSQEIIIRQRKLMRNMSVQLFWETLHHDELLPAGTRIKKATMHRFLKAEGLAKRAAGPARARSKYETPFTNDLWIADYMHGPKVLHEGKKRKAILCAIIDDHSRVLVGTRFSLSEQVEDILTVFREAIVKYGVPKKIFVDNGPSFRAGYLREVSARIGCTLLHSQPYDSPSRGKIERFNRTVRQRFLPRLPDGQILTLDELNDRFAQWLHEDYHHRQHAGINKMKPMDRLFASVEFTQIKRMSEVELDHAFMGRLVRRVRNDSTVQVNSKFYEVPPEFIGSRCDLRFPLGKPLDLFLYQEDKPVTSIKEVDLADNARFHARRIKTGVIQNQEEQS